MCTTSLPTVALHHVYHISPHCGTTPCVPHLSPLWHYTVDRGRMLACQAFSTHCPWSLQHPLSLEPSAPTVPGAFSTHCPWSLQHPLSLALQGWDVKRAGSGEKSALLHAEICMTFALCNVFSCMCLVVYTLCMKDRTK